MNPTQATYQELQDAFDHFNTALFGGELPECLITLQREKRTSGSFVGQRFLSQDRERTDEISLNPSYFSVCTIEQILQTIVRQMSHLWQFHFGKPGRRGYHNKEWAKKMEEIGLMPSHSGEPGGKKTGETISDYVIDGGRFQEECATLVTTEFRITWMDRLPVVKDGIELPDMIAEEIALDNGEGGEGEEGAEPAENKSNRDKYTCPCKFNVWGKPGLNIVCGDCGNPFEVAGSAATFSESEEK